MNKNYFDIDGVPAILWGDTGEGAFLYVHGKGGDKEEAAGLADLVCGKGWRVISVDLPEHGSRKNEKDMFYPWVAVGELEKVYGYISQRYKKTALMAVSIGAWFSMLAFKNVKFERCLFVSPLLDMNGLIANMMAWAGVSEEELQEKREIKTDFGETLSWRYYLYAKEHTIDKWYPPTRVLYAEKDNLTSEKTANEFCACFGAELSVMRDGEHWFHTPEQVKFLNDWTRDNVAGM